MARHGSLQEAYVHGVSTRAVDDLVRVMGGAGVSKSQVSRLFGAVDERVQAFLTRLTSVSRAATIAVGVNEDGRREVLGVHAGHSEAEIFWADFLRTLADCGLRGMKLVVADHHKGLRAFVVRAVHRTVRSSS